MASNARTLISRSNPNPNQIRSRSESKSALVKHLDKHAPFMRQQSLLKVPVSERRKKFAKQDNLLFHNMPHFTNLPRLADEEGAENENKPIIVENNSSKGLKENCEKTTTESQKNLANQQLDTNDKENLSANEKFIDNEKPLEKQQVNARVEQEKDTISEESYVETQAAVFDPDQEYRLSKQCVQIIRECLHEKTYDHTQTAIWCRTISNCVSDHVSAWLYDPRLQYKIVVNTYMAPRRGCAHSPVHVAVKCRKEAGIDGCLTVPYEDNEFVVWITLLAVRC